MLRAIAQPKLTEIELMPNSHTAHTDDESACPSWSFQWKLITSLALAYHLSAVVIAPLSGPPPATDIARWFSNSLLFRPYTRGVAIDNGYRFFAPNPGPSHIVYFEIDLESGEQIKGQFPDREDHWPRLLYHRYFMLSETVYSNAIPVASVPAVGFSSEQERADYDAARQQADLLLRGLARSLLDENRDAKGELGRQVRIYCVAHGIPTPEKLRGGMKLDDPQLYLDMMSDPRQPLVFEAESKVPLAGYRRDELWESTP